jgi:membrane protein DedA with SNARE-associated domain
MNEATHFLASHGGPLLFGVVFIEQIGLPLPTVPWLLGAGALWAMGMMNPFVAFGATVAACLVADLIWFYLGRRRGNRALHVLCKISLHPDSCVARTEAIFARYGAAGVMAAKFLPGLGLIFPPLAGMNGMSSSRFLLYDALGSVLYTGCFLLPGWIFSNQLNQIATALATFSKGALGLLGALAVAYLAFKYFQRRNLSRGTSSATTRHTSLVPRHL